MKYLLLLTLAAFITADLVNYSYGSQNIDVPESYKLKYSIDFPRELSWGYVSYTYMSVSNIPTFVTVDREGTVHFINLKTKKTISKLPLGHPEAWYITHTVRDNHDFVLMYSFDDGSLTVFKDGEFAFEEDRAIYQGQDAYYESPYIAVIGDFVIVKADEIPETLFKFKVDNTCFELIDQNDIHKNRVPLPKFDNIGVITYKNKDYLYNSLNKEVQFFEIKENMIKHKRTLDTESRIWNIAVIDDKVYGSTIANILVYNKDEKNWKTVFPADSSVVGKGEDRVLNFSRLNDNAIVVETDENLIIVNSTTYEEVSRFKIGKHESVSVFEELVVVFAENGSNESYIINVWDTAKRDDFSFLF